jgi:hypothetical protein
VKRFLFYVGLCLLGVGAFRVVSEIQKTRQIRQETSCYEYRGLGVEGQTFRSSFGLEPGQVQLHSGVNSGVNSRVNSEVNSTAPDTYRLVHKVVMLKATNPTKVYYRRLVFADDRQVQLPPEQQVSKLGCNQEIVHVLKVPKVQGNPRLITLQAMAYTSKIEAEQDIPETLARLREAQIVRHVKQDAVKPDIEWWFGANELHAYLYVQDLLSKNSQKSTRVKSNKATYKTTQTKVTNFPVIKRKIPPPPPVNGRKVDPKANHKSYLLTSLKQLDSPTFRPTALAMGKAGEVFRFYVAVASFNHPGLHAVTCLVNAKQQPVFNEAQDISWRGYPQTDQVVLPAQIKLKAGWNAVTCYKLDQLGVSQDSPHAYGSPGGILRMFVWGK